MKKIKLQYKKKSDELSRRLCIFHYKVEEYLGAPDTSTAEIDFKSEVERYLDLIEDHKVEAASDKPTMTTTNNVVKRRPPKKLNINALEEEIKRSSQVFSDNSPDVLGSAADSALSAVSANKPESKSIKDLQNKLIAEMHQKPTSQVPKKLNLVFTHQCIG